MMWPRPARRIHGSTACVPVKTAITFNSRSSRNSSGLVSSTVVESPRPALLTRTSMPPQRAPTSSTMARTAAALVTSRPYASASPPAVRRVAARCSTRSRLLAQIATRIPLAASRRAVASPMPAEAPVTMAIRPASPVTTLPALLAGDGLDGLLGDRDHPVELGFGDHERRREEEVLLARPRDDAALAHLLQDARADLLVGVEGLLGRLVFHELDGGEEALAGTDVAHVGMAVEGRVQGLVEPRAEGGRALGQLLPLHDPHVLEADRAARGMAGVGVGVHPLVLGLHRVHGLLHLLGDHDPAQREIAGGHALGEGHDVGEHVPVRHGEPVAGTAEPR